MTAFLTDRLDYEVMDCAPPRAHPSPPMPLCVPPGPLPVAHNGAAHQCIAFYQTNVVVSWSSDLNSVLALNRWFFPFSKNSQFVSIRLVICMSPKWLFFDEFAEEIL